MLAVKINAKNDRNGNPRRGWIIYGEGGDFINFIDEEYGGISNLHEKYPNVPDTNEIMVEPGEYKSFLRRAK
jgi:hypothetical protein